MSCQRTRRLFDERGLAMVIALFSLVILSALMLAFAVLGTSEPVIGNNHARSAQARALAESGLERAFWALSNTTDSNRINQPIGGGAAGVSAPAPYNGSTFISVGSIGGFFVTVSNPGTVGVPSSFNATNRDQRIVSSVGWAPNSTGPFSARKVIQATAISLNQFNPPCALCVRNPTGSLNNVQLTGNQTVRSDGDTSCGSKNAVYTTGGLSVGGAASTTNPTGLTDQTNVSAATFDPLALLTTTDLNLLKTMAKNTGTYWGPGSPPPPCAGSSVASLTFDAGCKIQKNGVIFVDTVSGNNPTPLTSPSDLANVTINGNAFQTPPFKGWFIVNGNASISGNFGTINGMLYAANNVTITGVGGSGMAGFVIAAEVQHHV